VPPIRQFNPHVNAELETVLNRALAGDPLRRYQSARQLAYDLNQVLFSLGRPVSSFNIAQLVDPIWRGRADQKRRKLDQRSLIGTLIDEALFEFTSLQEGESDAGGAAASPLNIGSFENVQDWAKDIADLSPASANSGHSERQFELGNLAALEEGELRSRRRQQSHAPGQGLSSLPPSVPRSSAPQKSVRKNGAVALLVLLLIAAGVVGAYFAKLL
jgi:hypothetical protein